ncbi:MAG: hypothetical protein ACSHWY_14170 [Octadecabacter sp.]
MRTAFGIIACLATAACQQEDTDAVAPQAFSVPEGSVQLTNSERGYVASLPQVMTKFETNVEGADFAYGSTEDAIYVLLSSGLMSQTSRAEMFEAAQAKLAEADAAVQFAELLDDRFVIFAISTDQNVISQVTQFGEDCAGQPMFGTVISGFNNDTSPIEYHWTNTHPLYPRFDLGVLCQ